MTGTRRPAVYAVAFTILEVCLFFLIYVLVGFTAESLDIVAALVKAFSAVFWRFLYLQVPLQFVLVAFSVFLFRPHTTMAALGAAFLSFLAAAILSPIGLDVPKLFLLHHANALGPGIAFIISAVLSVLALRKMAGHISKVATPSDPTL